MALPRVVFSPTRAGGAADVESLKDCDEVLKRNPKHFGALSGAAQIHLQLGQPELALLELDLLVQHQPAVGRGVQRPDRHDQNEIQQHDQDTALDERHRRPQLDLDVHARRPA